MAALEAPVIRKSGLVHLFLWGNRAKTAGIRRYEVHLKVPRGWILNLWRIITRKQLICLLSLKCCSKCISRWNWCKNPSVRSTYAPVFFVSYRYRHEDRVEMSNFCPVGRKYFKKSTTVPATLSSVSHSPNKPKTVSQPTDNLIYLHQHGSHNPNRLPHKHWINDFGDGLKQQINPIKMARHRAQVKNTASICG